MKAALMSLPGSKFFSLPNASSAASANNSRAYTPCRRPNLDRPTDAIVARGLARKWSRHGPYSLSKIAFCQGRQDQTEVLRLSVFSVDLTQSTCVPLFERFQILQAGRRGQLRLLVIG